MGAAVQGTAQGLPPRFGDRTAGGVVGARREHQRGAAVQAFGRRHLHALRIHRQGHRLQPQCVQQRDHRGPAGIFDRDAVARARVVAQCGFHGIQRARKHARGLVGQPLAAQPLQRHLAPEGDLGGPTMAGARVQLHTLPAAGGEPRKKGAVPVAASEIAQAGGQRHCLGHRGPGRGHARAATAVGHQPAGIAQARIGSGHGIRIDAQLRGQRTHGRQRIPARKRPGAQMGFDAVRDFRRRRSIEIHCLHTFILMY